MVVVGKCRLRNQFPSASRLLSLTSTHFGVCLVLTIRHGQSGDSDDSDADDSDDDACLHLQ